MAFSIVVYTPENLCDPTLAIAASRAGEVGLLNLGAGFSDAELRSALARLARHAGPGGRWGVRWDRWVHEDRVPDVLDAADPDRRLPTMVLAGLDPTDADRLAWARERAGQVVFEALDLHAARQAEACGFDGVVLKGNESGGRVGRTSSFLMLQGLDKGFRGPVWVQGAWGPDTAAIVGLAGAAGVVLAEELWLCRESPFSEAERARLAPLDGTETVCIDDGSESVRLFRRTDRETVARVAGEAARGGRPWDVLRHSWNQRTAEQPGPVPMGQGIAFAASLARRYETAGLILTAYREAADHHPREAARRDVLAPDGPLAQGHGTRYPIVQGPMTRVSDRAPFIEAVSEGGALPFLALALMRKAEARRVLEETKERLGDRPWGVGILGFVPPELREEQLEVIREVRPRFGIIAGGRPSQAARLEAEGIETYLHVPSPGLLSAFLEEGARKFVFEGRECGGHVGPRASLVLWQSAIEVFREAGLKDAEQVQILFAGGIHDARSAAMVETLAAPLVESGMKIGVLMGTSYLFTEEAVASGAITRGYQEEAIACRQTALLESGVGHATRCASTPFAEEFKARRKELQAAGLPPDEIRLRLELLNVGRLRVASKGLTRRATSEREKLDPNSTAELVAVDTETQRREGMYMIGALAALRDETVSMARLHDDVSSGSGELLRSLTSGPSAEERRRSEHPRGEPIAIVGMACLFPGAEDLETFWRNILDGVDMVGDVPEWRWKPEHFFDADRRTPDRLYSKRGAFLGETRFDPLRYMIPPATLASVEPAQLLSLDVTRRALADAGYDRRPFNRDRASVIIGCSSIHDMGLNYAQRTLLPQLLDRVPELDDTERARIVESARDKLVPWTEDSFPGMLPNVIAGRIANRLDLRGANFVVDAACSASLAAVHTAVGHLRSGTSDVVLAGAVDCSNNAFTFMGFAQTQALTPGDRPRPFDASADGIVLGEGVATLVLKRLADAERDGDSIYAVIRGVGCSSDGRNTSLTAPFPAAQSLALRRAYDDAGIDPTTVGLIEAHATGTALGDRAEIESLIDVMGGGGGRTLKCAVGSVKSMIGHTKTTAGLAGLVKATMALKHRVLPPTINVEQPNPALEADDAFYLNTETRPWIGSPGEHPRRAGVSAFGFGGTNFHIALEEYTGDYHDGFATQAALRPSELFTWSRESRAELASDLVEFRESIMGLTGLRLGRLARAIHAEERIRPEGSARTVRCAVVASSVEDLGAKLEHLIGALAGEGPVQDRSGIYLSDQEPVDPASVCFLFPGQGAQYPGMLKELAEDSPFGATAFEEADAMLSDLIPGRLSDRIFPRPALDKQQSTANSDALTDTRMAQPALGVVNLFALGVLKRFGLRPAMAAGHSYGESVALAAAGVFTRLGLLRLSARRGLVVHEVAKRNPGGMAAVAADEQTTRDALERLKISAHIANANAPRQTIIGASPEVLDAAVKGLIDEGIAVRRVAVSAAFHTPAMDEASPSLRENMAATPMWGPRFPVYSNVTAAPYPSDVEGVRDLLTRNLASCVRFVDQVRAMHRDGARLFIEVGPGRILTGLVTHILDGEPHTALALDQSGQSAWLSLGHLLARSHALGLRVDTAPWFEGRDLGDESLGVLLSTTRAESDGRPTDWWVGPAGARAVNPLAEKKKKKTTAAKSVPATAVAPPPERVEKQGMSQDRQDRRDELIRIHREAMTQWLDLQRDQVRLNERFLRLQERLVAAELGQPQPELDQSAEATTAVEAAPPARSTPGLSVAPAPILPSLEPTAVTPAEPVAPAQPAAEPDGSEIETEGGPPTVARFYKDLLAEVSQRTGYPEEMLKEDLPLESGLGIDSIKVMEIFSALKPYHHILATADQDNEDVLGQFVELKTLGAIRDHYARRREEILEGSTNAAPTVSEPQTTEERIPPPAPESNEASVDRLVVRSVLAEPLEDVRFDTDALRFSKNHVLLLVGDVPEYGPGLRAALGHGGYRAFQVVPDKTMRRAADHRYEVDFDDPQSLAELSRAIQSECGVPVGGIVSFLGLSETFRRPDLTATDAPLQLATWLLNLAKTFETEIVSSVEAGGGLLVNLTCLDGRLGLSESRSLPIAQAASLGFFKALSKEWRQVRVKNIDIDPDAQPEVLLTALVAEIANWDDQVEIGLDARGRWSVDLVEEENGASGAGEASRAAETLEAWTSDLSLDGESVVLATGGARGITAEVLRLLAQETGTRLVIVGRSPLTTEDDEPAELRSLADASAVRQALIQGRNGENGATPAQIEQQVNAIMHDRSIRKNLAAFTAAGSEVEYHAIDVRDSDALSALVADVYERYGRIDGVIHGAGVIEDRRLKDKTPESFARVFQTKVRPAMVLARVLRAESLQFLAFFSSVSARFGNAGQADYCAANECLNKLAAHLDREWPGRVVAMNWGPWDCGLISQALRTAYSQRGIALIPPAAGSRAFIDELGRRDTRAPEVVLACNALQLAVVGDETPDA